MLSHRIIACLDVKAGRVVKGVNFVDLVDAGDPVAVARAYDEQGVDELVFLDITASHEGRGIIHEVVRQVAEQCFMPFTVGGGIRTIDDVTALIQAGAEKVSINTAAVVTPEIVSQTAQRFGTCATVVNIDPKRVPIDDYRQRAGEDAPITLSQVRPGTCFEVHTHGGRTPVALDPVDWAKRVVALGAGEIVLTSMDADGTKNGYDLEITRMIAEAVDVPVVASGGCGNPEHMADVLAEGKADAALAASIFHFGEYTIAETKQRVAARGLPVRQLA
ncbi:imidazole glycerol phosphate synthase subunit HisF [Mucisphaera sp.]|uniref:imidazole glycerol phosphate synthase subunit HisF n=1 Tax=Mucisphaera sp. TaxID=2913024 RepID=UPI003D0FA560